MLYKQDINIIMQLILNEHKVFMIDVKVIQTKQALVLSFYKVKARSIDLVYICLLQ